MDVYSFLLVLHSPKESEGRERQRGQANREGPQTRLPSRLVVVVVVVAMEFEALFPLLAVLWSRRTW